jgi:drug/metabolite transporter (DMT)-like permease
MMGVQPSVRERDTLGVATYVLLCFIWGSTWMVIKVGYGGLGPLTVAGWRFAVAGLIMSALMPVLSARWPQGRVEWLLVSWVGLVLFAADYGLIYWSEQFIDSSLTAILFATLPLATIAFAHVYIPGDRITPRKLAGTLLAFVGVAALFGDRLRIDASHGGPMLGVIAATVCAAAAGVASKRHGGSLHPAALNGPAMLIGAAGLMVAAFALGERPRLPSALETWLAIGYLAIAGSVVSFLGYFSLLKRWSVTSLSFIAVFTPPIALGLGFVFLGERPTAWTAVGSVLILVGVTLALSTPKSQFPTPNRP